jgi:hypothetical protein
MNISHTCATCYQNVEISDTCHSVCLLSLMWGSPTQGYSSLSVVEHK